MAQLFNESIDTGIFPEKLKTGRVIPLHKGGDSNKISNFRPITILSVYSIFFEKLVHKTSFIHIAKKLDKTEPFWLPAK